MSNASISSNLLYFIYLYSFPTVPLVLLEVYIETHTQACLLSSLLWVWDNSTVCPCVCVCARVNRCMAEINVSYVFVRWSQETLDVWHLLIKQSLLSTARPSEILKSARHIKRSCCPPCSPRWGLQPCNTISWLWWPIVGQRTKNEALLWQSSWSCLSNGGELWTCLFICPSQTDN